MKRIIATLAAVLLSSTIYGQEQTPAQRAKELGLTPGVLLEDTAGHQFDETADAEILARLQLSLTDEGHVCGHPDKADPELAFAEIAELVEGLGRPEDECRFIREMHRALLILQATGAGAYPHSCVDGYEDVHAIYLFYDSDTFKSHMKRPLTDAELQGIVDAGVWGPNGGPDEPNFRPFTIQEVRDAWGDVPMYKVIEDFRAETYRRVGVVILAVDLKGKFHNIKALSRYIPGGVIGIGWFPDGRSCPGDRVEYHIDNSYTAGFQGQIGLDVHECGHTLQGPHQFGRHRGHPASEHGDPMSYDYRRHPFVGYSTGHSAYGIPRSPSLDKVWTRLYGGEPVGVPWQGKFADGDDPPPPTGDFPYKVGDEIVQVTLGRRMTLTVTAIEGDEGPGLAERVAEALTKVEDYRRKDRDRQAIAMVYEATAQAIANGSMTFEEGAAALVTLRGLLLGGNAEKWAPVFTVADDAKSAEGLLRVAEGLRGQEAVPDEIIRVIRLIAELLPDGNLKLIIQIILAILEGFGDAEATPLSTAPNIYSRPFGLYVSG